MADVFISHASGDAAAAQHLCDVLESTGLSCWIAPRDVRPGSNYAAALAEALERCRSVALLLSAEANESAHVLREIELASSRKIPIVPCRLEDVTPQRGLEYYLAAVQWLDAMRPEQRGTAFHALGDALLEHLGRGAAPDRSVEPGQASPDERSFLLRWFPPPTGATATLRIREDSRMTMAQGPDAQPREAFRQRTECNRSFDLTGARAGHSTMFQIRLTPRDMTMSTEANGRPFLALSANRVGGQVDCAVRSVVPEETRGLDGMIREQMATPLLVELTPRGIVTAVRADKAPGGIGAAGGVSPVLGSLQWIAGKAEYATFLANYTFMTFPEEPLPEQETWGFRREFTTMGAHFSGAAQAHVDGYDGSDGERVVRIQETTAYEVDGEALARSIASGIEASLSGVAVRPVSVEVDCPPVRSDCIFDVSAGHLVKQSSLLVLSTSMIFELSGPAGQARWRAEQSITYRNEVEWAP